MKPDDTQPIPGAKTCAYVPCSKIHNRVGDFCSDKCFRAQYRAENAKKPHRGKAYKAPELKRDWKAAILACCVGHNYTSPSPKDAK